MQRVPTAIIGLGYFGPHLLRNFAKDPRCDLRMACDQRQERLDAVLGSYPAVRGVTDAAAIMQNDEIALVVIATPPLSHTELAIAALEAGKHVLVEKPLATSSQDVARILAAAKKAGKHVLVDHTFLFAPAVQTVADYARSGKLGDLLYFESSRINLGLIQQDANVLWDIAIHDLTILDAVHGLEGIREVSAHGSSHFGRHAEQAYLHLRYESGFTAHIHASWLSPVKIRRTVVAGTRAMVSYDDIEPSEKIRLYDRGIEHAGAQQPDKNSPFFPKYRSGDIVIPALRNVETLSVEVEHILDVLLEGATPISSGKSAATIIRLLETADASMASGKALPFSPHAD